jgi:hypothetical protein
MFSKHKFDRYAKISPEFAARLADLSPGAHVRAILLLQTQAPAGGSETGPSEGRQSRDQRRQAMEATRRSAEQALGDIDAILEHYGGKRLANGASVLGSIPIETTAKGIDALAASNHVKAILEDQNASLIQ